ncbi:MULTISPECIES: hypothetical protein [Okeania]|uniref:hypothetical protein n=1 Tax=Okeania TaxID=1458928 RepID=UPI0013BE5189|nr:MULTISPECIES: hypothetical protein [Okeania]NET22789.1 hypothetical protein [Okeania sp. SIO1H5]NET79427.1 hypothetical protein [Okeania sp. SIO1F9]NET95994.1 hypothetical protein [Okeania sp. SIO1H2]
MTANFQTMMRSHKYISIIYSRGVGGLLYDINLNYLGVRRTESGFRRKKCTFRSIK